MNNHNNLSEIILTKIWYSITDSNDIPVINWFLTEAQAENESDAGEHGEVETYIGSNIYLQALKNED